MSEWPLFPGVSDGLTNNSTKPWSMKVAGNRRPCSEELIYLFIHGGVSICTFTKSYPGAESFGAELCPNLSIVIPEATWEVD